MPPSDPITLTDQVYKHLDQIASTLEITPLFSRYSCKNVVIEKTKLRDYLRLLRTSLEARTKNEQETKDHQFVRKTMVRLKLVDPKKAKTPPSQEALNAPINLMKCSYQHIDAIAQSIEIASLFSHVSTEQISCDRQILKKHLTELHSKLIQKSHLAEGEEAKIVRKNYDYIKKLMSRLHFIESEQPVKRPADFSEESGVQKAQKTDNPPLDVESSWVEIPITDTADFSISDEAFVFNTTNLNHSSFS